ncbi:MAG TPA: cupin domain-containing protein [Smithellaceae bacterium]|jgi:quercetin dioxygenase-like cupin family protein|nr:cupin domain-containing protein [Smithella sp.]HPL97696.1 cupin domain-containing protein [Smithellaceae bacterium]HPV49415.1 cupin domain-containing protein [Smithellaceae bacterium]
MTQKVTQIGDLTKAFTLAELALYQDHSVVSREIIRKPSGNMTIFAFDQNEGLSEHTAPFDALVYILEGEAEISIDKNPHVVKSGEMIIMPAGKPHSLRALTKFKMLLTLFK